MTVACAKARAAKKPLLLLPGAGWHAHHNHQITI